MNVRFAAPAVLASLVALSTATVSCGDDEEPLQTYIVQFRGVVGDESAACDQLYEGLGTTATSAEIKDFRFYVSNVYLIDDQGIEVPLQMSSSTRWSNGQVALIDFEDATGACSELGTAETYTLFDGQAPPRTYTGIVFDVGVPFELNHQDVTAAESPLDLGAMFWVWQGGYKFLRVDLLTEEPAPDNGWNMHLGSTMCDSAAPVLPPESPCGRPNRMTVRFDDYDSSSDYIVVDVAELVATSNIRANTPDTPAGCQSFPNDQADCEPVFPLLGLNFESGECVDNCVNQTVFRVEEMQ